MYFYYFRETKESDGYGNIKVARILSFDEPIRHWNLGYLKDKNMYVFHIIIDPSDFELPKWRNVSRERKESESYNGTYVFVEEGKILNRTFWLRENDLKRAQKIVNDYYKEVTEKNSSIYTKRMNSKIKISTKIES